MARLHLFLLCAIVAICSVLAVWGTADGVSAMSVPVPRTVPDFGSGSLDSGLDAAAESESGEGFVRLEARLALGLAMHATSQGKRDRRTIELSRFASFR